MKDPPTKASWNIRSRILRISRPSTVGRQRMVARWSSLWTSKYANRFTHARDTDRGRAVAEGQAAGRPELEGQAAGWVQCVRCGDGARVAVGVEPRDRRR